MCSSDLFSISLFSSHTMVRALFALVGAAAAQDPDQPHLAQAWTAQSSGDGMPGAVGEEAYFFYGNEAHHSWTYPQGSKLWTCPKGNPSCIAYYLKLNGPDCCKCDQVDKPKMWDIADGGLFTKVNFNGFEDTTELNENPIVGAEHWYTSSALPQVLTVTYDYFLHREDNGDVVSHRINFNTSVAQEGEILYGNFQVQHDLDAHRERFAVPKQCTGNILKCCDTMDEVDAKWFKHDYAVRQAQAASTVV